ncbi:MAG TPA: hypothetical protein VFW95_00720 [Candidatus Limnocylindria bacterium]|nr:hypothetical protein [Candidatus Limnocylindria bacterium]
MRDEPYPAPEPQPGTPVSRQAPPWPLIIGVALLSLLAVAMLLILLSGDDDPTASGSPSASASASGSASASASASPSVSAGASVSAAPGAALAHDSVAATAVDALSLRADPGLDAELLWRLPVDTQIFIVAGPENADGLPWYQVSGMGLPYDSGCVAPEPGGVLECPAFFGWLAGAADDGAPYLVPSDATAACPQAPQTIVSLTDLQSTLRLVCFDAEDMTFVAWWPELPDGGGPGGSCPGSETDVAWLVCQNTNPNVLGASPEQPDRLAVSLDPDSGVTMPDRGQWVEVTGHFDDPAAPDCGQASEAMETDAAELVFNCRLQFVPTAVVVTSAPSE